MRGPRLNFSRNSVYKLPSTVADSHRGGRIAQQTIILMKAIPLHPLASLPQMEMSIGWVMIQISGQSPLFIWVVGILYRLTPDPAGYITQSPVTECLY